MRPSSDPMPLRAYASVWGGGGQTSHFYSSLPIIDEESGISSAS